MNFYHQQITLNKEPSIKKWRIGWRFNAQDAPQYEVAVEKVGANGTYPGKSNRNISSIKFHLQVWESRQRKLAIILILKY